MFRNFTQKQKHLSSTIKKLDLINQKTRGQGEIRLQNSSTLYDTHPELNTYRISDTQTIGPKINSLFLSPPSDWWLLLGDITATKTIIVPRTNALISMFQLPKARAVSSVCKSLLHQNGNTRQGSYMFNAE